ncbi:hypothetical protein I3842_01G093700 [Carya illinoinensis]|uniref:Secreted protein n=1 Tax=Carya illinoinensis TaxID=32201 RepID=A0A922FYA6_CARIL|nr:hypothetical protein I3842_01G093700 [Carya illinoinensis]
MHIFGFFLLDLFFVSSSSRGGSDPLPMAMRNSRLPRQKEVFVFPDGYFWVFRLNLLFVGSS